ncbi:uncharacterized protein JCM6883_000153 [Sporobolomyces salmoneus]|uniref:uncharacterized protein n=1 Tax=Sporobolomyces salmoneus TaxID=183962 RepID=UPI0031706DCD
MPPRKRVRGVSSSLSPVSDVKPNISSPSPPTSSSSSPFSRPSDPVYYSYKIGRGEQLVLTFEPYKSWLLPLWRFKTVPIAKESSEKLWAKFRASGDEEDFVGMDMTRKFIQMGMTRAGRYANRAGGKKYGKDGELLPKTTNHKGAEEKAEASAIFREMWEKCKIDEKYLELRKVWEADKKKWTKEHPDEVIDLEMTKKDSKKVKKEEQEEEDVKPKRRKRS